MVQSSWGGKAWCGNDGDIPRGWQKYAEGAEGNLLKTAATGESVGDSGGLAAHDHGPHLAHDHPPGGLVDADANLDGIYNEVWAAGNSGASDISQDRSLSPSPTGGEQG